MRKQVRSMVVVLGLLFFLGACGSVESGDRAPQLDGLLVVEGESVRPLNVDEELGGHPILVEFWGTWCGPCRASMPHIQEMHERYALAGLAVLSVSDESPETIHSFMQENRYTFPATSDPEGRVTKAWGIKSFPTTVVVDAHGVVRHVGFPSSVEPVLAELVPAAPTAFATAVDVERMADLLRRGLYLTAADAISCADEEAIGLALQHENLREFCAHWGPRSESLANRAILAGDKVIGRPMAEIEQDLWRRVGGCGCILTTENVMKGVILDGYPVEDTAVGSFAREQFRRGLIMKALAEGRTPDLDDLDARVTVLLQEQQIGGEQHQDRPSPR
jgi:thiol-disulfide isomerase/thioredoxin